MFNRRDAQGNDPAITLEFDRNGGRRLFSNGNLAQCIGKKRVPVGIVDPHIDGLSYPLGWSRQNDHLVTPCSREEVAGCSGSLRFDQYG